MSNRKFHTKTHITTQKAIEELKITKAQFKSLLLHLNIRPDLISRAHKIGGESSAFKITDINLIYNSDVYKALLQNNKKAKTKEFLRSVGRHDLAERRNDKMLDFVDMVKRRYKNFSDALNDLGESLTFLYLFTFLEKDAKKHDETLFEQIKTELNKFEQFIATKKLIKQVLPSKKGVHIILKVDCVEILFFVPLQAEDDLIFDFESERAHIHLYLCHLMMVHSRLKQLNLEQKNEEIKVENEDSRKNSAEKLNEEESHEKFPTKISIIDSIYKKWLLLVTKQMEITVSDSEKVVLTDSSIEEKKEGVEYFHTAWLFAILNKSETELDNFKIGKFSEESFDLCYPPKNAHTFEKDFVDVLSKTKQKTIDQYIAKMKEETYFQ